MHAQAAIDTQLVFILPACRASRIIKGHQKSLGYFLGQMVKEKSIQILLVKRWKERIPASIKAKLPAHAVAMDDEPTNTKEHFLTQNTCAIQI